MFRWPQRRESSMWDGQGKQRSGWQKYPGPFQDASMYSTYVLCMDRQYESSPSLSPSLLLFFLFTIVPSILRIVFLDPPSRPHFVLFLSLKHLLPITWRSTIDVATICSWRRLSWSQPGGRNLSRDDVINQNEAASRVGQSLRLMLSFSIPLLCWWWLHHTTDAS